ncbi:UNVERIFIED_CONTAM: hypothetical protein K2H54_054647 [Gekko kuhli]
MISLLFGDFIKKKQLVVEVHRTVESGGWVMPSDKVTHLVKRGPEIMARLHGKHSSVYQASGLEDSSVPLYIHTTMSVVTSEMLKRCFVWKFESYSLKKLSPTHNRHLQTA